MDSLKEAKFNAGEFNDHRLHPIKNEHPNLIPNCEKRSQTERMQTNICDPHKGCHSDTNRMFKVIASFLLTLQVIVQLTSAAMSLPDGIENILGFVPRSTFQCERDGYFGDIDNDCRIFHLCQKQVNPNGRTVSCRAKISLA